jgi:hypothetical protein
MITNWIRIAFIPCLLIAFRTAGLSQNYRDSVKIWTETKGVGHSWITVGTGDSMILYSYGNYAVREGKLSGVLSAFPKRGIMLRFTGKEAMRYLQIKAQQTKVSEFWVKDAVPHLLRQLCDSLFFSHAGVPKTGIYKQNPSAHMVRVYRPLRYNCTTFLVEAIHWSCSSLFYNDNNQPVKRLFLTPAWAQRFIQRKLTEQSASIVFLGTH